MPIINRQDAAEVEQYIARFFAASGAGRVQALRRLFVEKLDFTTATGAVSLVQAPKNAALPPSAERIASMEGLHVVYVPLSGDGPDRVRKAEATAAAKLINDALCGDLLLVMTNPSYSQLHIIYPSFVGSTPSLRRMIIERYLPRRTAVQQLSNIFWQWKDTGSISLAADRAFDIEAVTKEFFAKYKSVFNSVMAAVKEGFSPSEEEAKKLFVQTLFNRLMFIYFLSRKGWLKFKDNPDYLNALRKDYPAQSEDKNFYTNRLKLLFFTGLNNPQSFDLRKNNPALHSLIGDVRFLNGGLFEETPDDNILVPDAAIDRILHELFDRFNFTVMESTPFDVEVAVDPEMLGKVFEELVTGRHESGSYYTPRPVVAFMCREALKGYLETQNTGDSTEAIAAFVDHRDTSELTLSSAPKIGEALARMKVVDPACGSGAYLLGMMQELVELMTALYSAQLSHEAQDLYNLKLRIIQQNLYGADIDQFAVNIAMLRLWLSLAIEYDGPVPPPLPNLDFKIACGDSLLGPDPSPESYGTLFRHRIHQLAGQLAALKDRHMRATGQEKTNLTTDIEGLKAQLREALADSAASEGVVDWRVEFAEVFDQNGGFDVAIANPPYVRQEDIQPNTYKEQLRELYTDATVGRSDLSCYFYARALQLLRKTGIHVFVCSNSWLDVGYGAKLQEFLLKNTWVKAIYDSAVERQFSTASINTIISVSQRGGSLPSAQTRFVSLRDLFELAIADPNRQKVVVKTKDELWQAGLDKANGGFVGDKWGGKYLRAPDIYWTILEKGKGKLVRLGDIAEVRFGIKTGANEFFYLEPTGQPAPEGLVHVRNGAGWEGFLEEEFLKPVLKTAKDSATFLVHRENLKTLLFHCSVPKKALTNTRALDYIRWGESHGFHQVRSVSGRRLWYDVGDKNAADAIILRRIGERMPVFEANGTLEDCVLFGITRKDPGLDVCVFLGLLNATSTRLFIELMTRQLTGAQAVADTNVYVVKEALALDPHCLAQEVREKIRGAYFKLRDKPCKSIFDEVGFPKPNKDYSNIHLEDVSLGKVLPDRRALDRVVFEALGLTEEEQLEVYRAVVQLVKNRLAKARSV